MINKPNGWENVKAAGEWRKLPPGGYIVEIISASCKESQSGYKYLDLEIEISEGEYKDYFRLDLYEQTGENRRYKGHYRTGLPENEKSAKFFKGMTTAVEESNPGYTWDWNEQSLVGKKVGCLFRDEEWEYEGKTGMRTAAFAMMSAEKVREGKFRAPEPKLLEGRQNYSGGSGQPGVDARPNPNGSSAWDAIGDDDIPF